jgi:hypothetical protein
MVRRRKINLRVQDAFQFQVVMKLGPIVRRDGVYPLAFRPQQFNCPRQRQFLGGAWDRPDANQARFPFHHRHHTRLAATMHRVHLPIPDPPTARHHRRPLFNGFFARQSSPAVIAPIPFSPLFPRSPQVPPQAPAAPFIRPNPTVNGLVAHDGLPLKLAPPNDLFGTKPLANQRRNRPKLRRPIPPVPPRAALASARLLHRMARAIPPIMRRLIPLHLPIQRATMPPKMFRHRCHPQTLPPHRGQLITFLHA